MDENFKGSSNDNISKEFIFEESAQIVISSDENFNSEQPIIEKEIELPQKKGIKKGIAIFGITLAIALLLAAACTVGYFYGRLSLINADANKNITLLSKPKDGKTYTADVIYTEVNKSVVGIVIYNETGIKGYASGIVYSRDGYIITNDHIYEKVPNAKFKIYDYTGRVSDAVFIAGDVRSDLAVIKAHANDFHPAVFGNSSELVCGEQVLAIGRPTDVAESASITSGIVSFVNRRVSNSSNFSSKLIQTDSAINPGSSGGALVNMYGQIVGITSSKIVSNEHEGVGYAIPTTTVQKVIESLVKNGRVVDRAKLGITYNEVNPVVAQISGVSYTGIMVASIDSSSDLYGKINENDIITHINDIAITKDDIVLDIIEESIPGTELKLTVINKIGKTVTVSCKLIADSGGSSYTKENPQATDSKSENNNGETFDFPFGY